MYVVKVSYPKSATLLISAVPCRRSNLVDLCQLTSMEFGEQPPLFAKPPGHVTPRARPAAGTMSLPPDAELDQLSLANPMIRCGLGVGLCERVQGFH